MNYSKEITEVHQEFNTAAEKLLDEAKQFLATVKVSNKQKIGLLEKFGFTNTPEFIQEDVKKTQAEFRKKQAELIEYYKRTYPNYKFIQEPQVKKICQKYGLICGSTKVYQGFVPLKNLEDIDNFTEVKIVDQLWKFQSTWNSVKLISYTEYKNFSKATQKECTPIDKSEIMICAPEKDFDRRGHYISDDYRLEKTPVPDPVVLFPVREGYLIITAWGDEASDPLVVNESFN